MAATSRATAASLEEDLLDRGHEFSFFQAMRLLEVLAQDSKERGNRGKVRIRPELSLSFPSADVSRVEKTEYGYLLTVTFLGLYGQASPLPICYTEQLMDESAAEMSATRDFLDLFNHRIYTLFYQGVKKYRLMPRPGESEQVPLQEELFCLIGLGEPSLRQQFPDPQALLPYAGLLAQHPRSALGLEAFLSDALHVPARVIQCVEHQVPVPTEQQLKLGVTGSALGLDTVVGSEVSDRNGKFRLQIGPLARGTFAAFLPGTPARRRLDSLLRCYLTIPFTWDLELKHDQDDIPATVLGTVAGGRLGWDSWLSPDGTLTAPSVIFPGTFD